MDYEKSHEVLKEAVNKVGAKSVAKDLRLSPSLVYKWCEPATGEDASGSENPLDRVLALVKATKDPGPIRWLCQNVDGYFVENHKDKRICSENALLATQRLLRQFTDVLQAVSAGLSDDNSIDEREASKIRREWEELKGLAEAFVMACEGGSFRVA